MRPLRPIDGAPTAVLDVLEIGGEETSSPCKEAVVGPGAGFAMGRGRSKLVRLDLGRRDLPGREWIDLVTGVVHARWEALEYLELEPWVVPVRDVHGPFEFVWSIVRVLAVHGFLEDGGFCSNLCELYGLRRW